MRRVETPTRVCVGVHVHAEPRRLTATLAALRAENPDIEILLLGDGPDPETAAALAALTGTRQSTTRAPKGAPACFNRLVVQSDADVLVLLESGTLVGPGWLDALLRTLRADARNGLAGPTTNLSWNEQGALARVKDVVTGAREARRRYGAATRTLEPLHSLGDFCYAVRRDVVEAVGAADEGYGLGPCWEMDYSVRAARAGFRGVWVCGAYVHRAPFTARRAHAERTRFDESRRLYQDRFCGLRLRGEKSDYEPHCRGEACEHFAPAGLIAIHRKLPRRAKARQVPGPPLVSCIMPTGNRADFALQAVRYFERQDYPARELVIVDDGSDGLERLLPGDERIRHVRVRPGLSIGAKRNRACEEARGELIAHWDDDDWYSDGRLSAQCAPLLAGEADMTALRCDTVADLEPWEFWTCTEELHRRLFVENVHGGTLVYRREVWGTLARYPDRSLAEDAHFLAEAVRHGARLTRLPGAGRFAYIRHGANAWAFASGQYLGPKGWERVPEPDLPAAARAFYAARSPNAAPGRSLPLVSCLMPTADRRRFVPNAIRYFLRQDYPARELVIVDDGSDPVADLVPDDARIQYVRLDQRLVLGEKRNRACELARGEVILHWDDDDWQASHRLRYQVEELERSRADLCGTNRVLYLSEDGKRAWVYEFQETQRRWLAGNGLCYRKSLWERSPFPSIARGEDTQFVWSREATNLSVHDDHRYFVGVVHATNTSAKAVRSSYWRPHPVEEVRALLGGDLSSHVAR